MYQFQRLPEHSQVLVPMDRHLAIRFCCWNTCTLKCYCHHSRTTLPIFSLDSSEDTGSSQTMFDPCGSQEDGVTTCDEDWDRDGVLDENEPTPSTFLGQMQVMQCTLAGNDSSGFVPLETDIFDQDQTDDDDSVSLNRKLNLGGVSVEDEEGAYLDVTLSGGQQYILVVGSEGTGPYELTVQAYVE